MGTFVLKSKLFFLAADGTVISRDQVREIRKGAKDLGVSLKDAMDNAKLNQGIKNESATIQRATQRTNNIAFAKQNPNVFKNVADKSRRQGFAAGQKSVGITKGAKNAWSRLGKAGKIGGLIAAGTVGGLGVSALMGGKKSSSQNNRLQQTQGPVQ